MKNEGRRDGEEYESENERKESEWREEEGCF